MYYKIYYNWNYQPTTTTSIFLYTKYPVIKPTGRPVGQIQWNVKLFNWKYDVLALRNYLKRIRIFVYCIISDCF